MQDSKRDTDEKNRLLDSMGEGEGGMIWDHCIPADTQPQHQWHRARKGYDHSLNE